MAHKHKTEQEQRVVVYYSLEGNTRFVAETLSAALSAETLELKPKRCIPQKGFCKYFCGGCLTLTKRQSPLLDQPEDRCRGDFVILGTPVWAGTYTPPVRTFLAKCDLQGCKVALFCCCASDPGRTLVRLRAQLGDSVIVGEQVFIEPLRHRDEAEAQAKRWARELLENDQ